MNHFWSRFIRHFAVLAVLLAFSCLVGIGAGAEWGAGRMGAFLGIGGVAWIVYLFAAGLE